MIENEIVYLYQNPLKQTSNLKGDIWNQGSVKEIKSFDYEKLQNFGVLSIELSNDIPFMAVSYSRNMNFKQKYI